MVVMWSYRGRHLSTGKVLSDELRAFNNIGWHRGTKDAPASKIGLSAFGPNINIVRDPRFGRNSELPGEGGSVADDDRGRRVREYLKACPMWLVS